VSFGLLRGSIITSLRVYFFWILLEQAVFAALVSLCLVGDSNEISVPVKVEVSSSEN
jgi:hypothetical protein